MAMQYLSPLDRTFHALGDQTRREILSMLASNGMQSATEIRTPFDVAQPTISKHLKVLEAAGLVRREVAGRTHRFELVTTPMDEAEDWIWHNKKFWDGTLGRLEKFLEQTEKANEKKDGG